LLIGKSQPSTALAIAAAIGEAEAGRAKIGPEFEALAERRRLALLADDDAAVDAIEIEQCATARKLDKLEAALEELRVRHSEAQAREAVAHRDHLYELGMRQQRAGVALLTQYSALAAKMQSILAEIEAASPEIGLVN